MGGMGVATRAPQNRPARPPVGDILGRMFPELLELLQVLAAGLAALIDGDTDTAKAFSDRARVLADNLPGGV